MSDIEDEPPGGGITVTIKWGKGYEEPWAVFRGSPAQVRENLIECFGMDREQLAGLTLAELVNNVRNVAQGINALRLGLGAEVISPEGGSRAPASTPAKQTEGPSQTELLLQAVDRQADVAGLKRLWAENQAAFADPVLLAAYKAKGKALSK